MACPRPCCWAVAAFWFWTSTRAPAFAERDLIVIADFVNTTGESVFGDALKQALSVQLQQTPYVTLLTDQQVQRTLRLMQRKPDDAITAPVARELCQRAGAKATVEGSIASLGSSYVITLGVHNCQTGESIAQQQVQAAAKEGVLKALGGAVTDLRMHLGESLASIAKYDVPAQATTSSLEALQAYGLANKTRATKGDEASMPFFQQAVDRDPSFALAYAKLSVLNYNLGHIDQARTLGQKAYDLRDRVSEYERLYLTWNYANHVVNDDRLTHDTLELMTTSYPRDFTAHNNLGVYYLTKGQFEDALKQFQASSDAAPAEPLPRANIAYTLFFMGRLDEGYQAAARSLAIRPDANLALNRWSAARLAGSPRADEFEAAARKLAPEDQVISTLAEFALWAGRLGEFQRLSDETRAKLQAGHSTEGAAAVDLNIRIAFAALQRGRYLDDLRPLLDAAKPVPVVASAAEIFAPVGDISTVRRVLPRFEKTTDNAARIPATIARAYVRLADGQGREAIADMEALLHDFPRRVDLNFHIGRIREAMGDLDGAATAYRGTIGATNVLGADMTVPAARMALAQLLQRRGDTAGANEQFDILLKQWKDADADFEMAKQVRAARGK